MTTPVIYTLFCVYVHLDYKVVYRRYASLYFIAGTDVDDNELIALELIHRYVEILDKWFSSVCELDIIFNFQQAYTILGKFVIIFYFTGAKRVNAVLCV